MTEKSIFALPELRDIFDSLRQGRHICSEDGKLYWALREHLEDYLDLFGNLGFDLQVHPRDFYYFRGKDSLSPQASRLAVFVFILIEALSDAGDPVVDTLMTKVFAVQELPHLKGARYRAYLKEVGVLSDDDLRGTVRQFERFGFVQRLTDETFRFRAPAYRFFDVCTQILKQPVSQAGPEGLE